LCLCLVIFLGACQDVKQTPLPILTPSTIDQAAPAISFTGINTVDWRFDPKHVLLLKGSCPVEGGCSAFDLLRLDLGTNTLVPLNILEGKRGAINCAAQGPNGQVVYESGDILYLYDPRSDEKTQIGTGCQPSFSTDGTKVAFVEKQGTLMNGQDTLKVYDLQGKKIENSISILPLEGESPLIESGEIGWRPEGQAVDVVYSWLDKDYRSYKSQIREIDLAHGKSQVIYEGKDITSYSFSPDGRLLAVMEYDYANSQSFFRIMDIKNQCEIAKLLFPLYGHLVRWSPTGESILLQLGSATNPYLFNVEKVFGAPYKELKCGKTQ
jgi:WD40 repeat protein